MADNQTELADKLRQLTTKGEPPKVENDSPSREVQKPESEARSTQASGIGSASASAPTAAEVASKTGQPRSTVGAGNSVSATNPVPTMAAPQGEAEKEVNAEVGTLKQQTADGKVVGYEDPTQKPAATRRLEAPAIRTSDIGKRIEAIDKTLKDTEDESSRMRTSDLALMRAQKEELERHERQRVSGAPILAPRTRLLDASYAQEKNPDYHYRWVNITDGSKVSARKADGWTRVPEGEGGAQLGDEMALFRIPKDHHRMLREGFRARQEQSFGAPKQQFEASLDEVAKLLRDRLGIKLTDRQIRERIDNSDR